MSIVMYPEGDAAAAVWIDLFQPSAEEVTQITRATGLRLPDEHDISEIESTSRLAFEKGAYHLSAPLLAKQDDGELVAVPVGFVLSKKVLVTVRYGALPTFDSAHAACAAEQPHSAEDAFLRIVEVVVDRSADKLEQASAECDALSKGAFRSDARGGRAQNLAAALSRVGTAADRVSQLRDSLLVLGRIAAYVAEGGPEDSPPLNAGRLKSIRADIASLTDYESHLSGKIQFLLDATLGFINIEQNEIVKTLTIASVVGIPPVLVAGIYGMNFQNMPELKWHYGYAYALALLVVSGLLPLVWFKKRGWM